MYLKRDDLVVVISGVLKGKQGRVLRVIEEKNQVVVQGVNLRFKHLKRSQKNPQGGRVQKEAALSAAKVQIVDPKTNRPTRVGFRVGPDGRKVRYAKKSGEVV
jgi:large subunit ribosomal protein L24